MGLFDFFKKPDLENLQAKNDVDGLINALKHTKPFIREKAARVLGEIGDTKVVEPLIFALQDSDEKVRLATKTALAKIIPDEEFKKLVSDAAIRRNFAILTNVHEDNYNESSTALKELGKLGVPAMEFFIDALKNNDQIVRYIAASYISIFGNPRVIKPLIIASKDENEIVRACSIQSLGELISPTSPLAIYDGMLVNANTDDEFLKRKDMENLLERLCDLKAVKTVSGGRKAIKVLLELRKDVVSLKAVELLINALDDNFWVVRLQAAKALGDIGDIRAKESLMKASLGVTNWELITEKDTVEKLKREFPRGVPPDAEATIWQRYGSRNEEVRKAALDALNKIKETKKETKTAAVSNIRAIVDAAKEASWSKQEEVEKLKEAIKKTWGVDCRVLDLNDEQAMAVAQQLPLDSSFHDIEDEYIITISSNAILIRAYGAFVDLGYAMFFYRDKLYYVNVEPTVQMVTSLYNRSDALSNMAKIMIVLNEHMGASRKTLLVHLEGDLTQ